MREQAHALWEQGKRIEALELLKQIPQTIDVLYDEGLIEFELNHIDQALLIFKECVTLDSEFAGAYYGIAICLDEQGQNSDALKHYELATMFDPSYAEAYFHMANLLEETDFERAVACYKKAIALSPKYYWAYANLGSLYERKFMAKEAEEMFRYALELEKTNISYYNLAVVTAKLGDIDQAIFYYEQANQLEPYLQAWFNMGVLYKERDEFNKAMVCYSNALAMEPSADVHYNMGCIFHLQGNDETAKFHLKISFELEPELINFALDDPELYELENWLSTL